jgi:ABC-type antimicrobial peptide transport system permease subunit
MSLVIKTSGDPLALVEPVRRAIGDLDPLLPIAEIRTLRDVVGAASADTRFATALLSVFGGLSLLLAATGIYGVVSYSVRQRTREIGIRMAIGAPASRVVREIVRDSGLSLVLGIGLGLAGAVTLGRAIGSLLVGVDPLDPLAFLIVVATVAVVTLLSALLPARRAAAIDPVGALRAD